MNLRATLQQKFSRHKRTQSKQQHHSTQHHSKHTHHHHHRDWKAFLRQPWVIVAIIVGLLLSVVLGIGIATALTVNQMKTTAQQMRFVAGELQTAVKSQNLVAAKSELAKLGDLLTVMQSQYGSLGLYRYIPVLSGYYQDGQSLFMAAQSGLSAANKAVTAVEPYADVLGLSGATPEEGSANAENRIKILLETLNKTLPEFDSISQDLEQVESALASIDANRYPESAFGLPVRSYIVQAQDLSSGAVVAVTQYRPALEQLAAMAGAAEDGRKKYFVLFQNDNELRPTGGFLTAFSTIFLEDGVVTPEYSDDIYELDKRYRSRTPIPPKLGKYLTTEKYWNLRDMNIDPDFKLSMDQFLSEYQTIGDKEIDGIIAVDTELLTRLLEILGPINIPGYGTFSAELDPRCDCPQVVYALSEIITRPTPYIREDRKGVLGPLMREILTKAYDAPSEKNPALFQLGLDMLSGRHVQFYFVDEQLQQAAETFGIAGRLTPPTDGSDFFALVNANLGGAKSNLFTSYDVVNTVSDPENGRVTKTVEVTFKNSRRGDNCNLEAGLLCLNSTLRDWTRIYLPEGSELVEAVGFLSEPETYEERGFTVIDGFFILEPNNAAKLRLTYTIPYDQEDYRLSIWKQGGIPSYPMLIQLPSKEEEITVTKDTTYQSTF